MLEHIKSDKRNGALEFFIEERGPDRVLCRMPVGEGALNPYGLVQAGAMLWLADVTASVLVLESVELGPEGQGFPLAVDLHASLLGNQRGGEVWSEARVVRRGRRVTVIRTRITGRSDRLLAEVTTTHVPAD
ncbi:MAG: PaaI family thioesterase [Proteobacteria bacterium]|nr:PaaI family thioesterase [Pseudomonadota bacterium]